ncbi:Gfo/Idh/MocA family protein [Jiangella endophytica]|uniref:Gfo/Idh/MocA family protein n=1 Tax=Jiangella endophytica TaxID=1623398 RepID=UPI000E34F695|nr:Gfo/Idh/MocA family oxidoreductase [Jiangella endophytica]
MKFAVIGAGTFGARHVQAYDRHPEAELVGICDLDLALATKVAATCSTPVPVFDRLDDLLAIDGLDAVSVVTPDHLHRDSAIAVAEAGKHLLVEKPLATTVEDAKAIVAAAEANGVTLMVDFHNRVNPPFVNAYDAVRNGQVGEVSYVYARLSNTIGIASSISWAGSSSSLWFLASHMVDVAQWVTGQRIVRVHARAVRGVLEGRGIATPDVFVVVADFASGALGVFEHAWILPDSHPTAKDLKFEVLGSDGAVYVDGSHNRAVEVYGPAQARYPDVMAPPYGPHLTGFIMDGITHFVDSVMGRRPVVATGEEGVQVTAVLCAALESIETGRPVEVPPAT